MTNCACLLRKLEDPHARIQLADLADGETVCVYPSAVNPPKGFKNGRKVLEGSYGILALVELRITSNKSATFETLNALRC